MSEQNASYLVKDSELGGKKLHKISIKIVQKALKMATTVCNISKTFQESMPPDPLELLLLLNLLQINNSYGKNRTEFYSLLIQSINNHTNN